MTAAALFCLCGIQAWRFAHDLIRDDAPLFSVMLAGGLVGVFLGAGAVLAFEAFQGPWEGVQP